MILPSKYFFHYSRSTGAGNVSRKLEKRSVYIGTVSSFQMSIGVTSIWMFVVTDRNIYARLQVEKRCDQIFVLETFLAACKVNP